MINLFQFAANDKSCSYLISIFGSMNGVVCNPGTQSVNATLGAMFQAFNSVILAVAAILVVYTTVVGVMATAHEGEFMGKKWNNIWIPIRMVLGIAALVPLGSGGYSLIQYVMMWVLVQGIGAADTLWATALAAVQQNGSIFAKPTIPIVGVSSTMSQLYAGLVCDATARINAKDPTGSNNGGYYCYGKSQTGDCASSLTTAKMKCSGNTCTLPLGPNGNCGTLTWSNPTGQCSGSNSNSLQCTASTAQNAEVMQILPALGAAAAEFASLDYNYRDWYANSWMVANKGSWQFIYDFCSASGYSQTNCCVPKAAPPALFGGPTGTCGGCGSIGATSDTCSTNPGSSGGGSSGGSSAGGGSGTSASLPAVNAGQNGNNAQNLSDDAVNSLIYPAMQAWIPTQSNITTLSGTSTDFIGGMTSDYANKVSDAATAWVNSQNTNPNSGAKSQLLGDASDGWITAGTYYYKLAGMNNNNLSAVNVTFSMNGVNPARNGMNDYRNNYNAATTLASLVTGASASPGSVSSVPEAASTAGPASQAMSGINQSFMDGISGAGQTNPLSTLQATGMGMLISVEVLFTAILVATIVLGVAGNIDVWALGTGGIDPAGPMAALMYTLLIPMMLALFAVLISLGGTLGVYVPLIPYIVFTFGAIGWLLAVIETMVAGPLVAIGIISPSGQHELLGKAEPALMLLFNVFLRPSLMIFGLMAAIFLASVVTTMINAAFWNVASSIGGLGDPLTSILFLAAYVMLIVSALNKCFAAIHIIPQQVMSWIGGHGQPGGAAGEAGEAIGEVKGGVAAAGGKSAEGIGGAQKTYDTAQGIRSTRGEAQKKKEEETAIRESQFKNLPKE